jgi:putative phosphoribosyl transferase
MFEDRVDAAKQLCPKLEKFSNKKDVIVIGLMRGGLVTAKTISQVLNLKLKPLVVKKIQDPQNNELAIGAMTSLKDIFLNDALIKTLNISEFDINKQISIKWKEIRIISKTFNINYKGFKNKDIILVDDGVATGASVIAARDFLKKLGVNKIILATPVIATDTLKSIKKYFNEIICLIKENDFYAVGQFYKNFEQISNQELARILNI